MISRRRLTALDLTMLSPVVGKKETHDSALFLGLYDRVQAAYRPHPRPQSPSVVQLVVGTVQCVDVVELSSVTTSSVSRLVQLICSSPSFPVAKGFCEVQLAVFPEDFGADCRLEVVSHDEKGPRCGSYMSLLSCA